MAGAATGGAETFFADLVPALARAGLDQWAVVRPHDGLVQILRETGLNPLTLPFGGRLDWSTRPALARAIRDWKPDIVQTWMNRATRHCPRGAFVHVGWLGGYYDPKYFRACDHTVAVTPDIVRFLREEGGWPAERSHYLPTFAPHADVAPVARESLDTPPDASLVVALGRLHEKKAFDVLLQAMAAIPGAWLWLAGDGPLRATLERQSRELGLEDRVRFLGWRNDREALLSAADVVAMPSRYEPFGTVMTEAWAARKPLVVAAAAGPLGLVRDGVDGLVVPIDNPSALADALRSVLEDPDLANSLANAGHDAWRESFTEEAVVNRYLDFYRQNGGGE